MGKLEVVFADDRAEQGANLYLGKFKANAAVAAGAKGHPLELAALFQLLSRRDCQATVAVLLRVKKKCEGR